MKRKLWTIMVYLAGDNDLEDAGFADLNEMKRVGTTDQINIVAQFDRQGARFQTRRYLITRRPSLETDVVEKLGETNTGEPNVLIDFVQWAVDNYPAEHYMLVIWNHGNGWEDNDIYHVARRDLRLKIVRRVEKSGDGIRRNSITIRDVRALSVTKFNRALFRPTIKTALTLTMKGVGYDDDAKDFLDNMELKRALAEVRTTLERKLDVLGMDACLMSMAEIGYQVRRHVALIVGSEENEPERGWPYSIILRALAKTPQMSARDLSSRIVRHYVNSYKPRYNVTLSACDLSKSEDLANAIDELAAALQSKILNPGIRLGILTARAQVQSYRHSEYVDLYDLCGVIANNCPSKKIQNGCTNVQHALKQGGYVVASGSRGSEVKNSHGVSIYFPTPATSVSGRISPLYTNLDFARNHKWAGFLRAWLKSLERSPRRKIHR